MLLAEDGSALPQDLDLLDPNTAYRIEFIWNWDWAVGEMSPHDLTEYEDVIEELNRSADGVRTLRFAMQLEHVDTSGIEWVRVIDEGGNGYDSYYEMYALASGDALRYLIRVSGALFADDSNVYTDIPTADPEDLKRDKAKRREWLKDVTGLDGE